MVTNKSWIICGLGLTGAAGTILTPMISKHFPNENRSKAAGLTASGGLGVYFSNISKCISKYFYLANVLLYFR